MECSLEDIRLAPVIRTRTCKLVCKCLCTGLPAVEAEIDNSAAHVSEIIAGRADHVRNIVKRTVEGGVSKAFRKHIFVDNRSVHHKGTLSACCIVDIG